MSSQSLEQITWEQAAQESEGRGRGAAYPSIDSTVALRHRPHPMGTRTNRNPKGPFALVDFVDDERASIVIGNHSLFPV